MKKLKEKLQQHSLNQKDLLMIKGGVKKPEGQGIPPDLDGNN